MRDRTIFSWLDLPFKNTRPKHLRIQHSLGTPALHSQASSVFARSNTPGSTPGFSVCPLFCHPSDFGRKLAMWVLCSLVSLWHLLLSWWTSAPTCDALSAEPNPTHPGSPFSFRSLPPRSEGRSFRCKLQPNSPSRTHVFSKTEARAGALNLWVARTTLADWWSLWPLLKKNLVIRRYSYQSIDNYICYWASNTY